MVENYVTRFPNDPNLKALFKPYGPGDLTNVFMFLYYKSKGFHVELKIIIA